MKKWWNDINEIYFRKPLKEELQLIEPMHLIKLLNIYENEEKKTLGDKGNIKLSKTS